MHIIISISTGVVSDGCLIIIWCMVLRSSRKYLRFSVDGKLYEFNALPMGLKVFIIHLYIVCMWWCSAVPESSHSWPDLCCNWPGNRTYRWKQYIYIYLIYIFIYLYSIYLYNCCNYTSLWLLVQWHVFIFRLVFKDGFLLA